MTTTRPRTTTIPGFRIQPMLPISLGLLGAVCEAATFTEYDGQRCVEAAIKIGNGMVRGPYTVVLSLDQAINADIIERVEGCTCEVCNGRDDDPAGIHGGKRAI